MTVATLPLSTLSPPEQDYVSYLSLQLSTRRFDHDLHDAYYNGEMRIADLGISIPPALRNLRTVMGWPRVVVDAIDERLDVEGFRLSDTTDADMDLWDLWQANNLDEESQLAHLDALVYGSAYVTVGSPDTSGDAPLICVESPLDLVCDWDPRSRTVLAAFRQFHEPTLNHPNDRSGTLYLPNQTISLFMDTGSWQVIGRDVHNLGTVPVIRMSNRARTSDRRGKSEITPEVISLTDAACRTFLGMDVAREFFAAPQRYILGASESAFQDAEGNPKSAWETYLGRVLALEGNSTADGQAVSVGQFAAGDPASFTKVLDSYATAMASITGLPSEYLGITTTIPSSADAIRMGTDRLVNKVKRKQRAFDGAWEETMRLALLIRDGKVSDDARSMETVWRNPEIPTPVATTQALHLLVQGGIVPATSDVVLEKWGFSAVEIARITADREKDQGAQELAELADSLQAKEARTDLAVATDISKNPTAGAPPLPTTNPNPNPLLKPGG